MSIMKLESCVACMIEGHMVPIADLVAVSALCAVDASVRVIVSMASNAFGRQRLLEFISRVARLAIEIAMSAY